jgi:hypothetical protein
VSKDEGRLQKTDLHGLSLNCKNYISMKKKRRRKKKKKKKKKKKQLQKSQTPKTHEYI